MNNFLFLAGSLWHMDTDNMEATYPLCHKEPSRSIKGQSPRNARVVSLWHVTAGASNTMKLLTNESQPSLKLEQ